MSVETKILIRAVALYIHNEVRGPHTLADRVTAAH